MGYITKNHGIYLWYIPDNMRCIVMNFSQPWFHAGNGIWVKPWACGSDRFSKLAAACTV